MQPIMMTAITTVIAVYILTTIIFLFVGFGIILPGNHDYRVVDILVLSFWPVYPIFLLATYIKDAIRKRNSIVKEIDNFRQVASEVRGNYNREHFSNLLEANRIVEGWRNDEANSVSQDYLNSDSNPCENKHENTISSIIDSRENIKSLLLKLQKEN